MGKSKRWGMDLLWLLAVSVSGWPTAHGALSPVLGGYDVVAYFGLAPDSKGVMGSLAHSHNLSTSDLTTGESTGTYQFWFSNESNRAKFAADPWRFAPKYGGF